MLRELRPAAIGLLLLTVLCGGVYPAVMTGIGWLVLPHAAHGSIVSVGGKTLASELIAQSEEDPRRFWPRPSATTKPYDATSSSGSNLGPSNPALVDAVKQRIGKLRAADPENTRVLPIDLVTTSGSGLDPDISVAAALYQAPRIARLRGVPVERIDALIAASTEGRLFGLYGEPRVNVGRLNRQLERLAQ